MEEPPEQCVARKPMMAHFDCAEIGEVGHHDVSLYTCKHCDRGFVHAFLESDGHSHSGRWYLAPLDHAPDVDRTDARALMRALMQARRALIGGSYFGGEPKWNPGLHRQMLQSWVGRL